MNNQAIIESLNLTENDLHTINQHGVQLSTVKNQVEQLKKGTKFIRLKKACTLGEGITQIPSSISDELLNLQREFVKHGSVIKFVPASGAASRMFKRLESFMSSDQKLDLNKNYQEADKKYLQRFLKNIRNFAFFEDLKNIIEEAGHSLEKMLHENDFKLVLEFLLTDRGLNYSNLPKALIKFHKYEDENKNAFGEQVAEAKDYIQNSDGEVNLHFTISPELKTGFESEMYKLKKTYTDTLKFNITYSFQKKSTDTIAIDMNDNLYRDNGELLFRPGGHGALIENLNDLNDDLIYIKNIDNVQRKENLDSTVKYKMLLGGLLVNYQKKIYSFLEKLDSADDIEIQRDVVRFIKEELHYEFYEYSETQSPKDRRPLLKKFLNRPLRVCGVVLNEGHPGGGPFWVEDNDGKISKQIVEQNQIDEGDENQKSIFNSSTHFNPVDIVCGVKDYKGNKFNLLEYVDNSAVLVSTKSKDGNELKALELPGLWNGSMADWITIFVEVPKESFTPVKEVNDLLQNYHN